MCLARDFPIHSRVANLSRGRGYSESNNSLHLIENCVRRRLWEGRLRSTQLEEMCSLQVSFVGKSAHEDSSLVNYGRNPNREFSHIAFNSLIHRKRTAFREQYRPISTNEQFLHFP